MPDRSISPKQLNNDVLHITEPTELALDNDVPAYLIDAGEEEVTRLDVVISAGSAYQQQRLIASSTGKLLKEGTASYSSSEIAARFDYLGAYLDIATTKDSATITLYSLTKHLPQLLPMIGEMLTSATFPEHELQLHLDRKKQEFLINSEKVKYLAMLEFNKLVFGEDSAYGQTLQADDFDKIHRDQLLDFYHRHYATDRSYLIISGKADHNVAALVNKYIGTGWKKSDGKNNKIAFTTPSAKGDKFIQRENAMQSAIRIGRPIISKQHPEYNRFILLNTILGGYFGSRLMSNLREEKGFTYGISSYAANYINGSSFSIATEVNVNRTQEAVDEIFGEMRRLREEKVGDQELSLVKNYIYGTFLRNFDGPFALADRFRSVKDFGLGFDYYLKSLDEIRQISSDELQETANAYLRADEMVRLVVGKMN